MLTALALVFLTGGFEAGGETKPDQTELEFTADTDDVTVRIHDNWELPPQVTCSIDGIEVVRAP